MAHCGSKFLESKWDKVFYTFFDLNKNGSIDYGDFEVLFEEVGKLRGVDSMEYKIAEQAMTTVWKGLLMATKGISMTDEPPQDVEISIDEWRAIWEKYDPRHMHMWQWEYLKYMFFLLDTSGDKYIDKKEYKEVMKIYKISDEDAEAAFDHFALDKNLKKLSKIDYGQFMTLWNEYFTSNDNCSQGNYLFGI